MRIEIRGLSKTFGGFRALDRVSLTIESGRLAALLGPSGSGKTTLLRIIAGLENPDPGEGAVLFDGRDMLSHSPRQREVGFVFQHYALFRHMTVFENIAFGLRVRRRRLGLSERAVADRVTALLRLIQLEQMSSRYPHQLSGGQRQRVALARALAVEPKALLLDEPFGALDAKVRGQLRAWLRRLHDEIGLTSVFVTHDQDEALELADEVVVMNEGRIEQVGPPEDVYNRPKTAFVTEFIGAVNRFSGWRVGDRIVFGTADTAIGNAAPRQRTVVFVRPHEFVLGGSAGAEGFWAKILRVHAAGARERLWLQADSGEIFTVESENREDLPPDLALGRRVFVRPKRFRSFPAEEARIGAAG